MWRSKYCGGRREGRTRCFRRTPASLVFAGIKTCRYLEVHGTRNKSKSDGRDQAKQDENAKEWTAAMTRQKETTIAQIAMRGLP